jgi:hypothetical protein
MKPLCQSPYVISANVNQSAINSTVWISLDQNRIDLLLIVQLYR